MWQSQCNILQLAICHFCIQNIFLVLWKYIRIMLLLSSDHHMNARNLLETYLDIHIVVYKIEKIILAVLLIKYQNSWFLLQPLSQQEPFIYVLWQNYISASIYLHRHWCLIFSFYLSLSLESNFNENLTYQEKHIISNDQYVIYIKH
jgi:hypothetical protein